MWDKIKQYVITALIAFLVGGFAALGIDASDWFPKVQTETVVVVEGK